MKIKDLIFKWGVPIAALAVLTIGVLHTVRSSSLGVAVTYFLILIILIIVPSLYEKMFTLELPV